MLALRSRQRYFKYKSAVKYLDLYKITKTNENYGLLYSQVAQQSLKSVAESFSSFRALERLAKKGEINQKPRLPKYRTHLGSFLGYKVDSKAVFSNPLDTGRKLGSHDSKRDETYKGIRLAATDRDSQMGFINPTR
jgi:hypothetical protein